MQYWKPGNISGLKLWRKEKKMSEINIDEFFTPPPAGASANFVWGVGFREGARDLMVNIENYQWIYNMYILFIIIDITLYIIFHTDMLFIYTHIYILWSMDRKHRPIT